MRLFSIIGPKTGLLTFPKFVEFLKISMVKEHWNVFSYFPAWRYAHDVLELKQISDYICL